jgi:hypothetical protein
MKRALVLLVLAACGTLVAGCSKPVGSVSGTVRYKGSPVPGGRIAFLASDGRQHGADIGEDGSYTVADVPVGPAKVSVDNSGLRLMEGLLSGKTPGGALAPKGKMPQLDLPKMAGHFVPIPPASSDPDKSGIVCEVHNGSQTFPVELK